MSALHEATEVTKLADQLAATLAVVHPSFDAARRAAEPEYVALLEAVRQTHARFAFDRSGRPGAIKAVDEALPVMERGLFEAILEDHACELAAVEEALYQFARALARGRK
jgi:hypothetical protein